MPARSDEHRAALGFLTVGETEALADHGVRVLDPFSTLISAGVAIGRGTVVYPGVIIQRDAVSALTLGATNTLFPGCLLLAGHGGAIAIGSDCELGPGSVQITADTPDSEIQLGDRVRLRDGCELSGRSHLGRGSQILGAISARSVTLGAGLGGYDWPEVDQRGACLKGTGIARDLTLDRGEVASRRPSFADAPIERQAAHHRPTRRHATEP